MGSKESARKLFGNDCRRQYADARACVCLAAGRAISPQALGVRTMNFGQHWRTEGIHEVAYSVEMPHAFWIDVFARELPEVVEDARKFPDDDNELDTALRSRGLPTEIDKAAALEMAPIVVRHFAHDLLVEWIGDGSSDETPGFVINTIDAVSIDVDRIRISGRARTDEIPVRYQDA